MSAATHLAATPPRLEVDPTPVQHRVRPRVRMTGYPAMSISPEEHYAGKLTTLQRGAWSELRMHLWLHGELPADASELADIAGVPIRTWLKKIVPAIMPHFDIDEDGRWRHFDMEEELAKRADRSKVNKRNADKRWGKDDATGNANGIANCTASPEQEDSGGLANGMQSASCPQTSDGLTDFSVSEEKTSVSP